MTLTRVNSNGITEIDKTKISGTAITAADTGTVTSAMIADGQVTSAKIADATIVNQDVSLTAAIEGTKISPNFGSQATATTGTSTAASFIPTGSSVPANGVYLPGANALGLATASTERVRITSGGLVGIGSAAPSVALEVSASSNLGSRAIFTRPDVSRTAAIGANRDTSDCPFVGATSNTAFAFITNDTERGRFDASGRLLIGASTAASGLASGAVQIGSGVTGVTNTGSLQAPSLLVSGSLEFSLDGVSGTQRHGRITGNGDTSGGAYAGGVDIEYYAYDGSSYRWYTGTRLYSSGSMSFGGADLGTANGNIGRIYKFFGGSGNVIFPFESNTLDRNGILEYRRVGRGASRCSQISFGENSSGQGSVQVYSSGANVDLSGGVVLTNGATSWSALSDIRLKEVVSAFDNALANVCQIEAFRYTWKNDLAKTLQVGVSAQSVQAVLPEAVSYTKPVDAEEGDDTEYLSVRYTEIIPLIIAALQESKARIEMLEAQVAALKAA